MRRLIVETNRHQNRFKTKKKYTESIVKHCARVIAYNIQVIVYFLLHVFIFVFISFFFFMQTGTLCVVVVEALLLLLLCSHTMVCSNSSSNGQHTYRYFQLSKNYVTQKKWSIYGGFNMAE